MQMPADRPEDVQEIAQVMLADLAELTGMAHATLDPEAAASLGALPWTGNLPQLRAVLTAVLLDRSATGPLAAGKIDNQFARISHVPDSRDKETGAVAKGISDGNLAGKIGSIEALEQQLHAEAITQSKGNLSAAARILCLTRAKLAYRLKKAPGSR